MENVYENMRKYGEEMEGKFSHKPNDNGIVISVTNPFFQEIHIECDGKISEEYYRPYSLLEPQADHPEDKGELIYYNTQEKCYYRFEWKEQIWVRTDQAYIVKHAQRCEALQAHFRMYRKIHKGQFCVFRCYAIDPNGQCKRPSTIESMFDRHKWFYNPFSFEVELLDENTIDDFVEGTPISKEMTQKMVRYHKVQDEIKRQKEKDDQNQKSKEKRQTMLKNFNSHIKEYEAIYRYIVFGGGSIGLIISIIQLIIQLID